MTVRILLGDVRDRLRDLPSDSVHCVVTSPPYFGLRDYGAAGQIGLEESPEAFVETLVGVFREVRRVLRPDGTLWLNLGDSYATNGGPGWQGKNGQRSNRRFSGTRNTPAMREQARTAYRGLKPKDLIGIPWRVAFALQADGWWLRSSIIWHKPNPMPESVTDRPTSAHEHIFLLAKGERYFYDGEAIKDPAVSDHPSGNGYDRAERVSIGGRGQKAGWADVGGTRNARNVWTIATRPFAEAHFATFPVDLAERCIKAGCPIGGTVLDPFGGAGTTGLVADALGRDAVLVELNPEYAAIAERRIAAARLGPVERLHLVGGAKAEGVDALPLFGGGA